MTTPERSVEEMLTEFEEFSVAVFGSYRDEEVSWLRQTLQTERQKREEMVEAERERSTKLWDMLDHIDSIPDMMHPNTPEAHEKCWRYMVEVAEKRHNVLKSDGFVLTHPNNHK